MNTPVNFISSILAVAPGILFADCEEAEAVLQPMMEWSAADFEDAVKDEDDLLWWVAGYAHASFLQGIEDGTKFDPWQYQMFLASDTLIMDCLDPDTAPSGFEMRGFYDTYDADRRASARAVAEGGL